MKTTTLTVDQPCWNCGGSSFTSSSRASHVSKKLICTECYEPQDDDDEYFEGEDAPYHY